MDKFLLAIKKRFLLPVVFLIGFAIWYFICQAYHDSYWGGTIHRVQTVDFNMLHHTLPTTLSHDIVANRDDLIQKVLDSNYGLFGLVVTDPTGESILYKTNKVYHRESWQKHISPEELASSDEPYDLLTDPPLLDPQHVHITPRSDKAADKTPYKHGRVLGRIYYVREMEPSLAEDIGSFLTTGFFEMSGAKRGYLFITTSVLELMAVALLLIWLRRRGIALKQQEIEHVKRELDIRKKALEHLNSELSAQKARKSWLEKEADTSYKRALALKQRLETLKDAITPSFAQKVAAGPDSGIKVRPPMHPSSLILEEIESIIPDLTTSAGTLKSQASMLHDYCAILEQKQSEMQRFVQEGDQIASESSSNLDMRPQ